ncbi:hypothetical protein ACG02S_26195 [Roseateles sp. DC23W]|uniref:Uncharacterized protein n=1 Tax=Pelomonas dachongensis TaxID=3299029 RepID=A0ABW7EYU2_9BURK
MTFVFEIIPESDRKKYGIADDSNFYRAGESHWAIDREREIFLLRRARFGLEGPHDEAFWAFLWKGQILDVHIKNVDISQDEFGKIVDRRIVLGLCSLRNEPTPEISKVLPDLESALAACGEAELVIPYQLYSLELVSK